MKRSSHNPLAILATFILAVLTSQSALDGQTLQIDSSTANWIEGFADFIRWEDAAKPEDIAVGIIAAPEVASYLERRASVRSGKPRIRVVELLPTDSLEGIDIVFVGGTNHAHWPRIIAQCSKNKTLSIGLQDGFVSAGGAVEFIVRRNRLRFYIDQKNAKNCGIVISSKLLELAIEPRQ